MSKAEYQKCLIDPFYFIENYYKIRSPSLDSPSNFTLYDFQRDLVLPSLLTFDNIVIANARQMGISTLVGAYFAWCMIFEPPCEIVVVAEKQANAKYFIDKLRYGLENLPLWMVGVVGQHYALQLQLSNDSRILGMCEVNSPLCGRMLSHVYVENAAFFKNLDDIVLGYLPSLTRDGQLIMSSTPSGKGTFREYFFNPEFHSLTLNWRLHPGRNEAWANELKTSLGEDEFNKQFEV
jgi:hypothetical protein